MFYANSPDYSESPQRRSYFFKSRTFSFSLSSLAENSGILSLNQMQGTMPLRNITISFIRQI